MKRKQCPVCKVAMRFNEIFPHIICWECSKHTQTKDGKDIEFYNDDVEDDIVSLIDDSGSDSASDNDDDNDSYSTNIRDCYIGDYECSAQKGQFGEVIFQLKEN